MLTLLDIECVIYEVKSEFLNVIYKNFNIQIIRLKSKSCKVYTKCENGPNGGNNYHSTVFCYTSSFLLIKECEIKITNPSRYLIRFVTINYHPPTRILSFVGHGYKCLQYAAERYILKNNSACISRGYFDYRVSTFIMTELNWR